MYFPVFSLKTGKSGPEKKPRIWTLFTQCHLTQSCFFWRSLNQPLTMNDKFPFLYLGLTFYGTTMYITKNNTDIVALWNYYSRGVCFCENLFTT